MSLTKNQELGHTFIPPAVKPVRTLKEKMRDIILAREAKQERIQREEKKTRRTMRTEILDLVLLMGLK